MEVRGCFPGSPPRSEESRAVIHVRSSLSGLLTMLLSRAKPVPPVCWLTLAADPRVANAKGRAPSCSCWCKCPHSGYANSIRHMWTKIQKPRRGPPLCVCFTQANVTCEGWRKHNIHRLYNVCCSYSAERQISKNPKNNCLVNDIFKCTKITVT